MLKTKGRNTKNSIELKSISPCSKRTNEYIHLKSQEVAEISFNLRIS